jgi:glycine cleavage system aminomethyltransferase T
MTFCPHSTFAAEDQLELVTSSGRAFQLIDVRVVGEEGADVAKDGEQVGAVTQPWWSPRIRWNLGCSSQCFGCLSCSC